ncbi:MAG: hypothetical protein QOE09_1337 [Ilumatobacteraceae bacterium]|jgi:PAS domain S-box-containing protein
MGMRVGELARRTGVGVSTLRAWESRFRFLQPERSSAGQRLYTEADVERVQAVLRLVGEGLTLAASITRVATAGTGALPEGEGEALLYGQILQVADQGIWVTKGGRTRYANRRMAEMMGYSIEELVAIPALDFIDADMLPLTKQRTELVRAGQRLHFTMDLRRSDGSTFLAELTTTPLMNQAGQYDGAVALVNDVTARTETQTQAQLRATLLDAVGEAVVATRPDGEVVYINRAAERLLGWRAAEVIGRQQRDVCAEVPGVAGQIHPSVMNGTRSSRRLELFRRDGTQFDAYVTSEPALDEHGVVVGLVAVISDQTERTQLDRDLRTRQLQVETLALLGAQALRQRVDAGTAATLILSEVVETTRRLLHADRARIFDVIGADGELEVRAASPSVNERIFVPAGSRSFPGYVALARKAVVVDNTGFDRRFDSDEGPGASLPSAIGAPVFGPNGIVGVLVAESSTPDRFHHDGAHFIQGMANIIGTALLEY